MNRSPQTYPIPQIRPVGETAFTVEFGNAVDVTLNRRVHALDAALRNHPPPGLIETVPTYCALLVIYDPGAIAAGAMQAALRTLALRALAQPLADAAATGPPLQIPVRYGGECGPDLADVAAHCALTPEEVIKRHSAPIYTVAMLGFAPGFAYLLGLPSELATPRLAAPRLHVPPGSIGIAGAQTGAYALETPGGWRIIGRTAIPLFDPARANPFTLHAGDQVQFLVDGRQ